MTKPFRPMLAASFDQELPIEDQLSQLNFPVYALPKYDGVRVLCHPTLGVVTRHLKPISNLHIRNTLAKYCAAGLDGEIMMGKHGKNYSFQATSSAVSRIQGEPDFRVVVFDCFHVPHASFLARYAMLREWHKKLSSGNTQHPLDLAPCVPCGDLATLLAFEQDCLDIGYEGAMIRSVEGSYKYGRATLRESTLIKLKRFEDAEAVIVGFEEMVSNQNAKETNELGLSERSGHKANLVPMNTLGAFTVQGIGTFNGVPFSIGGGKGLTQEYRKQIWDQRDQYLGKTITYAYQNHGVKDKPRMPQFKGFRENGT